MISEQTFPHREAVDHDTADRRDSDKQAIARYLSDQALDFDGATQSHAEAILRLLGR